MEDQIGRSETEPDARHGHIDAGATKYNLKINLRSRAFKKT